MASLWQQLDGAQYGPGFFWRSNMSNSKKVPPTKTFANTAAGREKAVSQAKRQGEKSITFALPTKSSAKKK